MISGQSFSWAQQLLLTDGSNVSHPDCDNQWDFNSFNKVKRRLVVTLLPTFEIKLLKTGVSHKFHT